jgi:hypothetical protein
MIQNKNYKRTTRQLNDRTKQLISQKLKGRMKSPQHIERIRTGMQNYWKSVGGDSNDSN